MKEDTKATRETKVKEEMMELMEVRVKLVTLGFPAVKVLLDQMVNRESQDQREMLVLMDRKEQKEILEETANQEGLENMGSWDLRVIRVLVEPMGTKESAVMMVYQDQMEVVEREE